MVLSNKLTGLLSAIRTILLKYLDISMLLSAIESRSFDYRRVFIEHPRLRLDGVYIATCHYM